MLCKCSQLSLVNKWDVWNEMSENEKLARFHDPKYSLWRYWWLATPPAPCLTPFVLKVYPWKIIPCKYIKIHVDMELALPKDYYLIIFICWLLSSCVKLFWINSEANSRQCHATIKNPPRSMQEVFGIIKESLWYIVEGRGASKSTHFNIQIT